MKKMVSLFLLLCAGSVCTAADISSGKLPRSSPEKQGISSSAVLAFIEAADEKIDTMNSFMLVRHVMSSLRVGGRLTMPKATTCCFL